MLLLFALYVKQIVKHRARESKGKRVPFFLPLFLPLSHETQFELAPALPPLPDPHRVDIFIVCVR